MLHALEREHASRDQETELLRLLIPEVRWIHRQMAVGVPAYRPEKAGDDPGPLEIPRPGEKPPVVEKKPGMWRAAAQRALQGLRG